MIHFGQNSEFKKLKSVLLYKPGEAIHNLPDPKLVQQNAPIDHPQISHEFDEIEKAFKNIGVQVVYIDDSAMSPEQGFQYNMMYCRDIFFMTPQGAIMANMANSSRSFEPDYAGRTFESKGIPIIHVIDSPGSFEGADALWISEKKVVVGVGHRTNIEAFKQIKEILKKMDVECFTLPSTQTTTQHLLGSLQIVDSDMAMVREHIINSDIITFLKSAGYAVHRIPENSEVSRKQAMNTVTVAPRKIVMTAHCPETKKIYEDLGLSVVAELEIPQLINGAGGLACATGILGREI